MNRETLSAPLRALARLYGVQTGYQDVWGQPCQAAAASVFRILQLLGAPLTHPHDAASALRARRQQLWQRVWEPVHVAWQGAPVTFRLRLPRDQQQQQAFVCRVQLEEGGEVRREGRLEELPSRPGATVEGVSFDVFDLSLRQTLPFGYHSAYLEFGRQVWQSLVISAPRQAYGPPPEEQPARWGLFLPLYALHSRQSYQTGDFSDLERLMEFTAGVGGSLVATLPLLATLWEATDDPSPYSAASRLFWNEVYLDPRRLPEFAACPPAQAAQALPDRPTGSGEEPGLVDYDRRMRRQRAVLEPLADQFFAGPAGPQAALQQRCREDPELEVFARFRAVGERQGAAWPAWPARLQLGDFRPDDYDPRVYRYHLYTQWQVECQLRQVTERARQLSLLWYLDFPLGVTRNGYDVWRERELFLPDASGGAPPDGFFTKGQDWGFPPLHPERLREQGYRHLIAVLRRHLQFARVLRFDHVMSLHRLYWVPHGMSARDGAYVRFPAEELFALLCLESYRHQAQIVGENLGTVPAAVNRALAEHNLRDMYVLQYEMNPERPEMLRPVPSYSVASLNTHDMPHFAAYWNAEDVDDRVELGLLPAEQADAVRRERASTCRKLVQLLQERELLPAGEADLEAVLEGCLKLLGCSASPMVLVNLEDLWLETRPQNVPGTFDERPNWRRRARYGLEDFSQLQAVQRILAAVDQSRRQAPGPAPRPPGSAAKDSQAPHHERTG